MVEAGGESDPKGPEEVDDGYGGRLTGSGSGNNRGVGGGKDGVPGGRCTVWM